MKDKIIIATRESLLALWQAEHVKKRIEDTYPEIQVELLPVTTKGDQILDRSLLEIGGKGLFIKELEKLLLEKKADIAVHSLKDMTAVIPDGLKLAAVTAREDPRDAFVSLEYGSLQELPEGAVVGDIQSPPTGAAAPFMAGSADKNASRECADKTPAFG